MTYRPVAHPGERPKWVQEAAVSEAEREQAASMRVVARALSGSDREDKNAAQRIVEGRASNSEFERFSQRVRSEAAKIPVERS